MIASRLVGLGATACAVAVAWFAPGDFVLWTSLRAGLVALLLAHAIWVAWRSPSLPLRGILVGCGVLLALAQWGFPALTAGMCGQETLATLRSDDAIVELVRSDCGATTGYRHEVILTRGNGLLRRRHLLVDAYLYPEVEPLSVDERTVRLHLRFSTPADSMAILEIPTNHPGPTRSFYRGVPSD